MQTVVIVNISNVSIVPIKVPLQNQKDTKKLTTAIIDNNRSIATSIIIFFIKSTPFIIIRVHYAKKKNKRHEQE